MTEQMWDLAMIIVIVLGFFIGVVWANYDYHKDKN